ncbi:LOW QUALITY PROTEIN: BBSome complex assembly protein BBS10 [Salvelinus alpinus]
MRLQLQCVQLDSVLQTVSVLEVVIRRSFGPGGGQVLFTRDTLLTRHTRILTALMVVECVRRHSSVTEDGSKTFVLLLASLLREIQKHTRKARREGAKRLAEALLAFGLDELSDVITVGVAPHGSSLSDTHTPGQTDTPTLCRLLSVFLHTRISPTPAEVISQLNCELLSHFPALHTAVSGFPIGCSRLLEGQVIHADFSTPLPFRDHGPIRALAVTEPLEPSLLIGGTVLELGGANRGIESVCVRSERGLDSVVTLQHLGVSLLLSSVRQSEAFLAAVGSGAQPVSDWAVIGQEHVATATFCQPLVPGAHRWYLPGPAGDSAVLVADGSNLVQADTSSGSMSGSGSGSGVKEVTVWSSSGASSGVESVSCKFHLILDVLQCLRSLLSVDTVLHTNTSHTCQREEEEGDD